MATIPLLLMTIHTLLLMLQGEVINIVTIDERVNLTCQPNSSMSFTWSIKSTEGTRHIVFTFDGTVNSQCKRNELVLADSDFTACWNGNLSVLSFLQPKTSLDTYSCEQSGDELQTYSVTFLNPDDIGNPVCHVSASSQNEDLQLTLSCETTFSQGELWDVVLSIEGTWKTYSTKPSTSPNIETNLGYDTFLNITNVSCILSVSGTQTTLNRSCQYPKAVNIEQTIEGNDVALRCDDVESNSEVNWIVYDSDGSKIDINNTSWTRDGGRSLLIRGVSSNHHGNNVVECRAYRNGSKSMIGYTMISTLVNENKDDNVPLSPSPGPDDDIFFVPALLFLTLWLITTTIFGLWWWRKSMERKRSPSSMLTISGTIGQTLEVNPPSTVGSNTNGEDGAYNDTPLANIETHSHRRAMSYNLNNSAHNPSFASGNVDRDAAQLRNSPHSLESSNLGNESQLYFTLERSSPSPVNSLQRASTPRWEHPDVNPASLDHPQRQSSHSQCYETVGEPNKGATSCYDLGEYAEVGYGKGPPDLGEYAEVGVPFQGKRPPDLSGRPSIRKKPGREKVKEDDISRLYSKVNK